MDMKESVLQQRVNELELEVKGYQHANKQLDEDRKVIYDALENTQRANKTYFTILKENGLI